MDRMENIIKMSICIVALSMIALSFMLIFKENSSVHKALVKETVTTQEIKSLELSKEHSSGLFTLGRDQNYTTYYVNVKVEEGYTIKPFNGAYVEIVETDDKSPCIKTTSSVMYQPTYVIYVPIGTLKEKYDTTIQ